MRMTPKREVSIPFLGLCVFFAFTFLGWLTAAFLFGKIYVDDFSMVISGLGIELCSALFVGASAGIAVNWYFKRALGETPKAMLKKSGISEIYPSRLDAGREFAQLVSSKKVKRLYLAGNSLHYFLAAGGRLSEVWNAIYQRLKDEQTMDLIERNRLKVRLLLLDPRSSEGCFRQEIERKIIGGAGLSINVPNGLEEVSLVQQSIFNGQPQEYLQVRLYSHCPFSFIFATEHEVFVKQYYYRDYRKDVSIPLIKYSGDSPQYGDFLYSYNVIWENADPGKYFVHRVGTALSIEKARIKNVFRIDQRRFLSDRVIECIASAGEGDTVSILAISGKFYVSYINAYETLCRIATSDEQGRKAKVRFALVNPVSKEAILRAVADKSPKDDFRDKLFSWSWNEHRASTLYTDVHETINALTTGIRQACSFELRLYSCSIPCSLLITPDSAIVEQYLYGRSKKFRRGLVLGGEYPVFEYQMRGDEAEEKTEQEIINSTFEVIWKSFSISIEDYNRRNEMDEFNKNIEIIRNELGSASRGKRAKAVKQSAPRKGPNEEPT